MITKEYLQQELAKRIDGYKRGVETSTDNIIAEMKSILVLVDALPDYEKKYNESMLRADEAVQKGCLDKAIFDEIFPPEESEDERIRKKLYHTVLGTPNDSTWFDGTSKKAMLAWLEKKKESHIPWYDYQKSKEAGYTIVPNEEYEQLIKQKEQKPQVFCEAKAYDLGYKQGKEDAIKEQKPAESREEILHQLFQNGSITLSDYLYLTEEQKPAEWNEEDEEISKRIISDLRWGRRNTVFDKDIRQYDEEINWMENKFKSLRPSWKPSEEQMEALRKAVNKLTKTDVADSVRLSIMYDNLKRN